jgi:hypothetical protein
MYRYHDANRLAAYQSRHLRLLEFRIRTLASDWGRWLEWDFLGRGRTKLKDGIDVRCFPNVNEADQVHVRESQEQLMFCSQRSTIGGRLVGSCRLFVSL